MKVAIIEDEVLAQKELSALLASTGMNVEVATCLSSIAESVLWLQNHANEYDLLLMDIELADGQCFEIFEQVQLGKPVVFTTAYDEHAIKAFKYNSLDYLLKPI